MPVTSPLPIDPEKPNKAEEAMLPPTIKLDKDSPLRSLSKALSWRLIATTITILIVFVTTKEWELAFGAGAADLVIKLVAYYLHERAWANVKWGRVWYKNQMVRAIKLRYIRRKRAKRKF